MGRAPSQRLRQRRHHRHPRRSQARHAGVLPTLRVQGRAARGDVQRQRRGDREPSGRAASTPPERRSTVSTRGSTRSSRSATTRATAKPPACSSRRRCRGSSTKPATKRSPRCAHRCRDALADGAASGDFPDCDPDADAATIHAIVWRLFTDAIHGRATMSRDDARSHVERFAFRALGVAEPTGDVHD